MVEKLYGLIEKYYNIIELISIISLTPRLLYTTELDTWKFNSDISCEVKIFLPRCFHNRVIIAFTFFFYHNLHIDKYISGIIKNIRISLKRALIIFKPRKKYAFFVSFSESICAQLDDYK